MTFRLLLLVSLLGLTEASGYACQGPIKLSPTADLSQTLYWPSIWNDSMAPIPFSAQQKCQWQINVPDGLFATVVFYKDAPSTVGIWVEYTNGYSTGLANKDYDPYIFTSPQFFVNLGKSQQEGLFSFKVKWSKYPNTIKNSVSLRKDGRPIAQAPNSWLTTFTAETAVSLVAFTLKNSSHFPLLRQSAIYDGDSTNAKYLGNLLQILMSNKAMVSSGKSLTLYTFGLDQLFNYTLYMAQDAFDDEDIDFYKGWNCPSDTNCPVNLNAISGDVVAATIDKRPEYIKRIGLLPTGAVLQVYEGVISNETMIANLTSTNYQNYLPLAVKSVLKQYHLSSHFVTAELSRDADDAGWGTVFDGRILNIHSFDYGKNSYNQDTADSFITLKNQKLYFKFQVNNCDFNGSASLEIHVYRDGATVFYETFHSGNLPPALTLKLFADKMTVKYQTFGNYTKGFQMDLTTTRN